ncbi:MAG: bifunctional riboflavin kinase/FAD synthetase [Synechococcales cyanobacterium C42_A2020_086]|nr:bifunctional riboflavin kinase/FAD synthetase [Synechococcales cyanobacterium C42_A2020_086]
MWITSSLQSLKTPTFVALGNFDGVHQGHRKVIEPILTAAGVGTPVLAGSERASVESPGLQNAHPTVVTFHPHPQEFFTGQRRLLLTPIAEKAKYLESLGVEQLVLLPFDQNLANLTPAQFVEHILIEQLQAQRISVGQNFRFGRQRAGTTADLQRLAADYGVPVDIAPLQTDNGERISSSAIRQALSEGNLQRANRFLGRSYCLVGQVTPGQQLGRALGFPTANLTLPSEKFLPRSGVYRVWVQAATGQLAEHPQAGVMNLGYRPTVDGSRLVVEVHLLDWSGDLYGQTLSVHLEQFLRPEQKFASLDELQAQIRLDCNAARTQLSATS